MRAELLFHTPLEVLVRAARTCTASVDKMDCVGDKISDSDKKLISNSLLKQNVEAKVIKNIHDYVVKTFMDDYLMGPQPNTNDLMIKIQSEVERLKGPKHDSVLEHVNYSFDLEFSRAVLQEFSRHRHSSPSVQSTRYTLKKLSGDGNKLHITGDLVVDFYANEALKSVSGILEKGVSNDLVKYASPEALMTKGIYTINARSIRNIFYLRTHRKALKEFRSLAGAMYDVLPDEHKFLFDDVIWFERT